MRRLLLVLASAILLAFCLDGQVGPVTPAHALPLALESGFPTLVPGEPYLYVVDYYQTIRVVEPRIRAIVGALPVGWGALPVFAPGGDRLYVVHHPSPGAGAQLDVFALPGGRHLASVGGLETMSYKIWGPPILAPTPDGRSAYLHGRRITSQPGETGRDECWIERIDLVAGRGDPTRIPLPACRVAPLLLAADARTLYSGPWLIDLAAYPATVRANPELADRAVAQSVDGRWLYALDRTGTITVWDANEGRVARTLPQAVPPYGSYVSLFHPTIQISRDGARLYVASDDGDDVQHDFKRLLILDAATGQRLGELQPPAPFRTFTVSPDGATCATLGTDETGDQLALWDCATGAALGTIPGLGGSAGPVLAPPAGQDTAP